MVHERSWSILISESIHLSIPFSGKNDGWKSASPYLGKCKVVSYCNPENENAAMDLKSIKPPVKPFCSLILSLSIFFFFPLCSGKCPRPCYWLQVWLFRFSCLSFHNPTPFSPVSRRVDMDIAGTSNSLLRTSSKQEVPRPWLDEDSDWDKIVIERKINAYDWVYLRMRTMRCCDTHLISLEDIRSLIGTSSMLMDPRGYLIHPTFFLMYVFFVHFWNSSASTPFVFF